MQNDLLPANLAPQTRLPFLKVKQKRAWQHKSDKSPKRVEHLSAHWKSLVPAENECICHPNSSWRQLATSSSCSVLAMETAGLSLSSHKEQIGLWHAPTFACCVKNKDVCSAALAIFWLQGTSQVPSFINEENNMHRQLMLTWKQRPLQRRNEIYWISFLFQLSWINSSEFNTTLISYFKTNTDQIALASI